MRLPLVTTLVILVALGAMAASAADAPPERISRECSTSTPLLNYPAFAFRILGLHLDGRWVLEHGPELESEFATSCAKLADCYEMLDNPYMFCDDNFVLEIRPVCDRKFPRADHPDDWEECRSFVEAYAIDVDDGGVNVWRKAQAWSKTQPLDPERKLAVTISPAHPVPGVKSKVTITAVDVKSGVPVYGLVNIGGKSFRCKDNPAGVSATLYAFDYTFAFDRVKNAEGHYELVSPEITIETLHHQLVRTRFDVEPPLMIASVRRAGRRRVVVEAKDAATGRTLDAAVLVGDGEAGRTSRPIAIAKKDVSELWVRADGYADVRVQLPVSDSDK